MIHSSEWRTFIFHNLSNILFFVCFGSQWTWIFNEKKKKRRCLTNCCFNQISIWKRFSSSKQHTTQEELENVGSISQKAKGEASQNSVLMHRIKQTSVIICQNGSDTKRRVVNAVRISKMYGSWIISQVFLGTVSTFMRKVSACGVL